MSMRNKALRRHNSWKKAIRKRNICTKAYGWDWYGNLHRYSKNKIHCSCGMCRFKSVYEPNRKTMQEMRQLERTSAQIKEYYS